MIKNYFFTFLILCFLALIPDANAQDIAFNGTEPKIEKLSIYPNPVNSNRQVIYIESKLKLPKQVDFFNAIGKKIYSTNIVGNELNISRLSTGVYFLKVTEKGISETRKLVIN